MQFEPRSCWLNVAEEKQILYIIPLLEVAGVVVDILSTMLRTYNLCFNILKHSSKF